LCDSQELHVTALCSGYLNDDIVSDLDIWRTPVQWVVGM
jgi:hypothetical protein